MLLSFSVFKTAEKKYKENFSSTYEETQYDQSAFVFYVVALSFLILEIALMYYAIMIAISNSRPGINRFVHVVLAILVTIPYLLINTTFINGTNANLKY